MRYPLFLDIVNQPVVVVGAGQVAARKVRTLLRAGARVTVISPAAIPAISRRRSICWIRREYRPGDLRGAVLAIAATDSPTVNRRVCTEARRRRLLINCITPPAAGNFIVPSLVTVGKIALAISTGGLSPAFAKGLRLDLEKFLGDGYPALLKRMAAERKKNTRATKKTRTHA